MTKVIHENLIDLLVGEFPSFKHYTDFTVFDVNSKDEKVLLLPIFGRYVKYLIDSNNKEAEKILIFLNTLFNQKCTDETVKNDIGLDIFEIICIDEKAINLGRRLLSSNALKSFEESIDTYNPEPRQ
jgi:hypothetical protein